MCERGERKFTLLEGLSHGISHMPSNTCLCGSYMLHMMTSVQSDDVETPMMMWHAHHHLLCCHGSQCNDMDPIKNDTDPVWVYIIEYRYMNLEELRYQGIMHGFQCRAPTYNDASRFQTSH
jgi:hypothetical protein